MGWVNHVRGGRKRHVNAEIALVVLRASDHRSGSEKGVLWKRSLFKNVHFLEKLVILETWEILEIYKSVENKGESEHFLEILENLDQETRRGPEIHGS